MTTEQEYLGLMAKLVRLQKAITRNATLQELKQAELFKTLKVDGMDEAEVKLKKLGKSAKIAEVKIKELLEELNDDL